MQWGVASLPPIPSELGHGWEHRNLRMDIQNDGGSIRGDIQNVGGSEIFKIEEVILDPTRNPGEKEHFLRAREMLVAQLKSCCAEWVAPVVCHLETDDLGEACSCLASCEEKVGQLTPEKVGFAAVAMGEKAVEEYEKPRNAAVKGFQLAQSILKSFSSEDEKANVESLADMLIEARFGSEMQPVDAYLRRKLLQQLGLAWKTTHCDLGVFSSNTSIAPTTLAPSPSAFWGTRSSSRRRSRPSRHLLAR